MLDIITGYVTKGMIWALCFAGLILLMRLTMRKDRRPRKESKAGIWYLDKKGSIHKDNSVYEKR